ncbi:hypothetical protein B0A49_00172 [Cryomyces minteri]|uniref:UDENN domain-containing protein n=1 Tax=Cryomyces minteri TaxID=331657 RepID=A0A4U0XW32_9PEZI|nr:hypothetical protein B0A49_00172 [Cryomyces minteri]
MVTRGSFSPIVTIVGFHHARGPEVEQWFGVEDGSDPAVENEWPLLPFMALSDGAHTSTEDFSYFTLRREATLDQSATSLFGISCTRQLASSELIDRPADVTRSTVQKAVVVTADSPHHFGQLREKLSVVTKAWFAQRDFTDVDIMQRFQESLAKSFKNHEDERDQYFGLSLREMIHEFKHQTLVLFKCCLLQPKFSLISLIPGLIRNLQDCSDPLLNNYEETLIPPTSLRTSERASLLSYMGLPLQIFGKGSLFGPYTPLQQLDMLADHGTKSYVVGTTNSLLLQQRDRYSDILINLDEDTINISSPSLRNALALSTPDRRWIDFLTQAVNDTWDESNPERPTTLGYTGSEEFIRLQFEEYLLALLSAVKYRLYVEKHKDDAKALLSEVDGDPANEFGSVWIEAWMQTENFRVFQRFTDSHLFDIVEPRHPCAGGITVEDVQRRLAQQVHELHLDERFSSGREVIGKHLATGQKKVSSAFNNLWADIEVMREAQRKKHEEHAAAVAAGTSPPSSPGTGKLSSPGRLARAPDLSQAQASVQAASARAGAYLSSWGTWASEKRKTGWSRPGLASLTTSPQSDSRPNVTTVSELSRADAAAAGATASLGPEGSPMSSPKRQLNVEKRGQVSKDNA